MGGCTGITTRFRYLSDRSTDDDGYGARLSTVSISSEYFARTESKHGTDILFRKMLSNPRPRDEHQRPAREDLRERPAGAVMSAEDNAVWIEESHGE